MKRPIDTTHEMLAEIKEDFANFEDDDEENTDFNEKPNDSHMMRTTNKGNFKDKSSLDNQSMISSIRKRDYISSAQ